MRHSVYNPTTDSAAPPGHLVSASYAIHLGVQAGGGECRIQGVIWSYILFNLLGGFATPKHLFYFYYDISYIYLVTVDI